MVSQRCKMMVSDELQKLGLKYENIGLGSVKFAFNVPEEQLIQFAKNLKKGGLEILENRKEILNEKIVNVIIEMVHHSNELPDINYSDYISRKLKYNYNYLSNIFMEQKGISIQQYIILHKINKVIELLHYNEMSLTEISHKLDYSSVSHLSNQFKKITGYSPRQFKQLNIQRTSNLEDI